MKFSHKILLAAAPVVFIAACGGGDDSLDDRLDIADPKVRFIHAIPAGPNVDLYRNTTIVGGVTNAPYRYASNYFDVIDTGVGRNHPSTAGHAYLAERLAQALAERMAVVEAVAETPAPTDG